MSTFRIQALAALACLVLSASAFGPSFAYSGKWHVVENLQTQACYRVADFHPTEGWRDFGVFNTFRTAGAFVWAHRDICRSSPVFS